MIVIDAIATFHDDYKILKNFYRIFNYRNIFMKKKVIVNCVMK